MSNDYEELDWPCPQCTLYNSYLARRCSACHFNLGSVLNDKKYDNHNPRINSSKSNPNLIDSNNNGNNGDNKYTDMFKNALNSIGSDFKNFINGINSNGRVNANKNKNLIDDSQDVIEIDPKTNKPIKNNIYEKRTSIPKSSSNGKNSPEKYLWTCGQCTFASNPDWATKCDVCDAKRNTKKDDKNKTDTKKSSPGEANAELTIYDTSLNEDIYDYARIWTCKRCTYINFGKDEECELCHTNRSLDAPDEAPDESAKANSNKNQPVYSKQKSKENSWVCVACTYMNSNNLDKCLLCNTLKDSKNDPNCEWACKICSHRNKSNITICVVCANDINSDEPMDYDNNTDDKQYDNFNINDNSLHISNSNNNNSLYNYSSDSNSRNSTLNPSLTFRSQKAKSIMINYTNATNQAEKIWNNILRYCKENNTKFVDDSFPPCDKSLFIDPSKKPDSLQLRGIKWLSPEGIRAPHDEFHLRWSVYNEPKFNDIKQGLLGNCWLLSGLAVIIEQPEMLQRIIITKDFCPQGCYQVRLCHNGEWQTVIVDDLFPCDSNNCLIYSQANRKQLWVPLIEKAMAKLNGSYESLIAGQTVEGLSTLTGYPCDSIKLERGSNEEEIDLDMIWARLLSIKEAGYAMGASCGRAEITDDTVFTNQGLLPRHAYSLLNVKEVFGNQLIQLRNPWGRYTWTGDWSEGSNKWTPEIKKALGFKGQKNRGYQASSHNQNDNHYYNHNGVRNSDQGVFWMSFSDFVKYFCSIDICKTRLDWFESRMSGIFNPEGTREMQAYHLVVFETSEINIGLFHKTNKNRRENSDLDMCFVVLQSNGRKNSVGKMVATSKRAVRKFIGCEHIFEPGEYIIVPFSFNSWYTTRSSSIKGSTSSTESIVDNNLYNLVIHSPKCFFLEQEMHAAFLLADSVIQLCLSQGSRTCSGLENACIYTLAKGYSGLIVIAENLNPRAYLHVELDCERSNNVVSTRQALTTRDSVPPLHRQVLIVLSQLEGSSSYSIQYSIKYRLSSNPYLNTWPGSEGQMITNFPPINKQTFGLHAPRSVYV